MDTQKIPLESIRIDGGTQIRLEIRTDVVEEYAERIDKLPPVTVFLDGSSHWLADGFHRYHAARKAGATTIEADVRKGTVEDARWFAVGANKQHGLRRTNDDKRKAVIEALLLRPKLSDRAIGEYVGVDHKTVSAARANLDWGNSPVSDKPGVADDSRTAASRLGRDGRAINTARIGKHQSKAPTPPATASAATSTTIEDEEQQPAKQPLPKSSARKPSNPLDRHPAIKALLKRLYNLSCYRDEQLSALAVREIANQLKKELAKVL